MADPPWAQPGITCVPVARPFLSALRRRDTLVFSSPDGDVGYPLARLGRLVRGHGVSVSPRVVAASPPPAELVAYHRSFGLGPERVDQPRAPSACLRLATLVLADPELRRRLGADQALRHALFAFKDREAELVLVSTRRPRVEGPCGRNRPW